MMVDVNVLSRYYDLLVANHIDIAIMYLICHEYNRVDAYGGIVFYNILLYNKYTLKPSVK